MEQLCPRVAPEETRLLQFSGIQDVALLGAFNAFLLNQRLNQTFLRSSALFPLPGPGAPTVILHSLDTSSESLLLSCFFFFFK